MVAMLVIVLVAFAIHADLPWFERHVYPAYCARSSATLYLPVIARVTAVVLAGLGVWFVRPRLDAWTIRIPRGQAIASGIALVAAIAFADLVLRQLPTGDRTALVRSDLPRAVADPDLGWRFAPSQTFRARVEYAIDGDGNRAATQDFRFDPDAPTLILDGESIAFGESLGWNDGLAARLGRDLGVQVIDLAVPAYSLDQTYRRLLEVLPRLHRVEEIVTTLIPESLRREGARPRGLSRLWRDEPYHDASRLEHARQRIADIASAASARGVRPLFVLANYGADCIDPDPWLVHALFDRPDQPHVRVFLPSAETIGAPDYHPNAQGAARIAAAIEQALGHHSVAR